jgi:hypothetical protein
MEKVIPSFQYEALILPPKLETANEEEEERGNNDGAKPSSIKIEKKAPTYLRGGKDSP